MRIHTQKAAWDGRAHERNFSRKSTKAEGETVLSHMAFVMLNSSTKLLADGFLEFCQQGYYASSFSAARGLDLRWLLEVVAVVVVDLVCDGRPTLAPASKRAARGRQPRSDRQDSNTSGSSWAGTTPELRRKFQNSFQIPQRGL